MQRNHISILDLVGMHIFYLWLILVAALCVSQEKVDRQKVLVGTSFPRRVDPCLAAAPPDLPASVYYTPDPFNAVALSAASSSSQAPMIPEGEEDDDLPFLLARMGHHLSRTEDIAGLDIDVVLIDIDYLVEEAMEDNYYSRVWQRICDPWV